MSRPTKHNRPPGAERAAPLLLLAACFAGCDFPGRPNRADRPLPANRVLDFATLYRTHCSACHGSDGQLGPAPPLNDPLFLSIVPDDELLRLVAEGRRGTPMPGFSHRRGGPLTDAQVQALAQGIKPRWQAAGATRPDAPSYLPPPSDHPQPEHQQAERAEPDRQAPAGPPLAGHELGQQLFARACGECHGERGTGGDMAGDIHDPAFLQLISDQGLRRLIITGRPDLGMPNFAETDGRTSDFKPLDSDQIEALVGLLASWRQAQPREHLELQPGGTSGATSRGSRPLRLGPRQANSALADRRAP